MARKAKPSHAPQSAAVQEWIKQQEAEKQAAAGPPAAAPSSPAPPPGPIAPGPIGPPAPINAPPRVAPRASDTDTKLEVASYGKIIALCCVVVLVGFGVFGFMKYVGKKATGTPALGSVEINQLRQGMTPEQAQAILGKPNAAHEGLHGPRESKMERALDISFVEVYRKGTLLLGYDKQKVLVEVVIGETPDEYYQRKEKQVKAVWEEFPETGFIHQDVWRPNQPGL